MNRIIGIRHRTKKTVEEEARPTEVVIFSPVGEVKYDLEDDTAELDWVRGTFPIAWRKAAVGEDRASFQPHHLVWKRLRKDEKPEDFQNAQLRQNKKEEWEVLEVPAAYEGLRLGDRVAMIFGGSGDRFVYALSRSSEKLSGDTGVYRVPAFVLKSERERLGVEKDVDANTLAVLLRDKPELFRLTKARDRELIKLICAYRERMDNMRDRISCELRLRNRLIGKIFCSEDGLYPEGSIEDLYLALKASDEILAKIVEGENEAYKRMAEMVESHAVYLLALADVEGVGASIAGRLIVAIGDVRKFATEAKLKAYIGAHVRQGGKYADVPKENQFPRRRKGELANYQPDGRQALYLLGDQFNRRPNSVWGQKLLQYKAKFQADPKHAEWKKGAIHRKAVWRTVTRFVEWFFRKWWEIEKKAESEGNTEIKAAS